jgi:hypothetical protein
MFGLLSLYLGRDINWDLKNYHYYNAYAFLENRLNFDIAPAQLQTYLNPLGDLPFYWMTKYFPSWVAGFVLGVIHGFNLSLIFSIFWKIFNHSNVQLKLFLGVCIVIISGIAPGFISELGNTMNDNLVSLFALSAIVLLISVFALDKEEHISGLIKIAFAGLVMGLGVGIKPTIAILAISSAFAFCVLRTSWENRLKSFLVYGLMGIIGGVISTGFWWWKLWARFGNPVFPIFNHIFKSPYFSISPNNWLFFYPKSLWEYLTWPFIFSLDSYRVNQLQFFDLRYALLYIVAIAWLVIYLFRKTTWVGQGGIKSNNHNFDIKPSTFLLLFFLFSYILWIMTSSTYRLIITVELLVPLCFIIILERFVHSAKFRIILVIVAICLTFCYFKPFDWGRLGWGDSYFILDTARLDDSGNAIVIMLGNSPTSYVIPKFPPNYRFVRPEGNLFGNSISNSNDSKFFADIKNLLNENYGTIYILYNKNEGNFDLEKSLANLELSSKLEDCFLLIINTPDELEFCRLSNAH